MDNNTDNGYTLRLHEDDGVYVYDPAGEIVAGPYRTWLGAIKKAHKLPTPCDHAHNQQIGEDDFRCLDCGATS
jgi:hypothetical protein